MFVVSAEWRRNNDDVLKNIDPQVIVLALFNNT